jgi:hypothetical protein
VANHENQPKLLWGHAGLSKVVIGPKSDFKTQNLAKLNILPLFFHFIAIHMDAESTAPSSAVETTCRLRCGT